MSQRHGTDRCSVQVKGETPVTLVDNFNRRITYLRLSVTDRCDLRCSYCCPEQGIDLIPHEEILTFEEIERLVAVFTSFGVQKVRITGGEPFARKNLLGLLEKISNIDGLKQFFLTTNGIRAADHLDALAELGIHGINLSLDSLDPQRFLHITRRDRLEKVLQTLYGALKRNIPLKINSVVLEDTSDQELLDLAELSRKNKVDVRFIESMPFSGAGRVREHQRDALFLRLRKIFPAMEEIESSVAITARLFSLPGFTGRVGIIEGNSRHFCRSCNKVRITATGMLKTCLYDNGVLDLKELLRRGCDDAMIGRQISMAVSRSFADGHAAEKDSHRSSEPSMAAIGG